jgi:hypothetical protein
LTQLTNPALYRGSPHIAALAAADAVVPPGATVETGLPQIAHLAGRDDVYWPDGDRAGPDYVVLDLTWFNPTPTPERYEDEAHPGALYAVVFSRDKVVVLRRIVAPPPGSGVSPG